MDLRGLGGSCNGNSKDYFLLGLDSVEVTDEEEEREWEC
jgi:hypothetical protein